MTSTALALTGTDDEPDEVTIYCPECNEPVTGKAKGAGSATWKMSTHRRQKHNVQGAGKTRARRRGAPTAADHEARPVISALQEIAAEARGTGKGAPSSDQLAAALGRGVSLTTAGFANLAVETDRTIPRTPEGDRQKDALVEYLAVSDRAALALMRPVGRLLAPTGLNARYGRTVVENVDIVGSFAELATVGYHWVEYLRLRRESNALLKQQIETQRAAATGETSPRFVPPTAAFEPTVVDGFTHSPAPTEGRVMTAADVQAMQARAGGN